MRSAGIDIGSRAIKLVLCEDSRVVHQAIEDTGSDPLAVCRRLLDGLSYDRITGTGYGRHLFKEHWPGAEVISEIKAVAAGATALIPGCRTVVDIGGQDSKAIALDPAGKVQKFVMNDRCAAGTGQFLEMMATALAFTREEFVAAARRAPRAQKLSSMCSVFAQSEVVSLIARGASKDEMALGVHQSIASRTAALAGGVPVEPTVVFTGGCAQNGCLVSLIAEAVKHPVQVPESPQTVAAFGCALYGAARWPMAGQETIIATKPPRHRAGKEVRMKYGARNAFSAKVKSVKQGDVMSLVKFDVTTPATMASVLTTESLEELDLKPGEEVLLVVKAIHVLPVKE